MLISGPSGNTELNIKTVSRHKTEQLHESNATDAKRVSRGFKKAAQQDWLERLIQCSGTAHDL
eukprot:scaffold36202_cov19-Tisochrysis_lutea.AAC.2